MAKISSEKITVELMINLYCRKKHGLKKLCPECEELKIYAHSRLNKCPYGDLKPACKDCKTHCYQKLQRDRVRTVMRYSGPRMLIYFPLEYIRHRITLKRVSNKYFF